MKRTAHYLFHDYSDYNSRVIEELESVDGVTLVRDYLPSSACFFERIFFKVRNRVIKKAPHFLFPWLSVFLYPRRFAREARTNKAIVVYECSPYSGRPDFLAYFKKRHPDVKLVLVLTNILGSFSDSVVNGRVSLFASLFDAIITYDADDAAQNGFLHYEGIYSAVSYLSEEEKAAEPLYDLYFCGLDKGRLQYLVDVYDSCISKGLTCRFDIVNPDAIYPREGIFYYTAQIPYEETMRRSCSSRALLELLSSPNRRGTTLRPYEAYALRKKILTNNRAIREKKWYNEKQVKILEQIDDIDPAWIKVPLLDGEATDIEVLSPKHFIDFLDSCLFE